MAQQREQRKPIRVLLSDIYDDLGGDTNRGGGSTERKLREEDKLEQLKQFMEVTVDALEGVTSRRSRKYLDDEGDLDRSSVIFDCDKGIFRGVSQIEKDELKVKEELELEQNVK